jgi:hypothetical protein
MGMSTETMNAEARTPGHSRKFRTAAIVSALVLLAAGIAALETVIKRRALREPPDATGWPAGAAAAGDRPEFLLPDVAGLAGPEAAGPETVSLIGRQVPRITVTIDRNGNAVVGRVAKVSPWRGVDLPRDVGGPALTPASFVELVVHLEFKEGRVRVRVQDWETTDLAAFQEKVAQLRMASGKGLVLTTIAARPDMPFGHVAGVTAVLSAVDWEPEFRPPPYSAGVGSGALGGLFQPPTGILAARAQIRELADQYPGPDGLSALGVRIRADSRAPWGAVSGIMMFCAQAKVWRISFACWQGGHEAVIGRVRNEANERSRPAIVRAELPDPPSRPGRATALR